MLVQFSMKNVLSFKDEITLDMTSIPAYKEHQYNLIQGTKEKFLRVAAIYGANASGKSNLYYGIQMFQNIVMRSMNAVGEIEDNILEKYYNPFAFDDDFSPSEYQIIVCDDSAEYSYGFEFDDKEIISEWFYVRDFASNRKSIILERSTEEIKMGASIRRECDRYKNQISKEALALTFFSRLSLKTEVFHKVFVEISHMMIVDTRFYENPRVMERFLPDVIDNNKDELIRFLTAIDTGIRDISYDTIDKKIEFFTYHNGKDQKKYKLNLYNESQGTLKSIIIFIIASSIIMRDGIMIVDELNIKLHPLLLKFVIDLFNNKDSSAQLIYTTHDTTLLDRKFFRRDQIWFVQKDDYGYSSLSALSDFKIRSDASFEKDYLSGVYGGIPSLSDYTVEAGD
ncbi:ATPase/GTPase, AAA15 family [Butyrivibrio proteoclasticus]|uniref:ATPase/GTPase, AAA15 family n=1 Tax=Butyrivibrio proteoclasticus TaxID=43305 RepID=A0A1I5PZD7_9FIRM|nr:ATP-binding protein [Butyrivibrio proteoclasticus]SFP39051.1 ATPase/GTPase, AAA15 family [Butyrivibrio proteoclasticus]